MRLRGRHSRSRGRGERSPTSSTIDSVSPKHTHTPWFFQSFDDYDNDDSRYTAEGTFDCDESQLSLTIYRVNTEATGLTSGYTGDYTADTFRSDASPVAKKNTHAISDLIGRPASPQRREGFTNQSVVLKVPTIDAAVAQDGDNNNTSSSSSPNHPKDVLEVQSQFIEHKSRDELKPFAIVEVEVRTKKNYYLFALKIPSCFYS